MKKLKCLRCNHKMEFLKTCQIDKKNDNLLIATIPKVHEHIFADIYVCNKCGYLEFYLNTKRWVENDNSK